MTGNEPEGLPSKSAGVFDVPKKEVNWLNMYSGTSQ